MDIYLSLVFVCSVMATNPHHCETIRGKEYPNFEECAAATRTTVEHLLALPTPPFPSLPHPWEIRGVCVQTVLYEVQTAPPPQPSAPHERSDADGEKDHTQS